MTPENVAKLLARLAFTWPNFTLPTDPESVEVMVEVWCEELAGVTNPEAVQAVKSLSAEGREFPPAVGLIRKRALELRQQVTGEGVPNEAEAWAEVKHLIARRGWPNPPAPEDCSHPALHRAITAMGWMELCKSENEVADRAHFLRLYAATANSSRDFMASPATALVGGSQRVLDAPADPSDDVIPYRIGEP